MIYLMNPETHDGWLPIVTPLLSKAYETTNIGTFKRLDDVRYNLSVGKEWCFLSEDCKCAGVFDVLEVVGGKKVLHFYLCGGEEPSGGWKDVDGFLEEVARVWGCSYIQLEGRLGWKRKVEPLGYKVDSLVLIKEVADEPR